MSENNTNLARIVYIVSDGTGITAEALARSVLTQFDMPFQKIRLPFVNTLEKTKEAVERIKRNQTKDVGRPIIFSTLAKPELISVLKKVDALHLDVMQPFLNQITEEIGKKAKQEIGLNYKNTGTDEYENRMEAINFTIAHDDGQSHANLQAADIILLGISRSGKTPTSLYLAIQYGLKVANYPLIPEDFERGRLPSILNSFKNKLFGLSISPERLSEIRQVRLPNSKYASIENCRYEVGEAEKLMERDNVLWFSSTNKSIEEIASSITHELDLLKENALRQ